MKDFEMTTSERMAALMTYKPMDRIPVIVMGSTYAISWTDYTLKEFFYNPALAYEIQKNVIRIHGYDGSPGYSFPEAIPFDLGGELIFSKNPHVLPILKEPICKTFEDVQKLEMPDLSDKSNLPFSIQKSIEFNKIKIENGEKISVMPTPPTQVAASIVGVNNLMKWFYKAPEVVHMLHRKVSDYLFEICEFMIEEFGIENCTVFEPFPIESQNLISPKVFEEFCLPYITEANEKIIKKNIKGWTIHLCGNHKKNLRFWKNDIKIPKRTVVSIGSSMDLEEVAEYFGPDYVIGGNVSTSLLKTSNYKEIYKESCKIIDKMKYNEGGFILMPACGIAENTPHLNVQAMVDAAKEYGKY